jgi:hypothetical protein
VTSIGEMRKNSSTLAVRNQTYVSMMKACHEGQLGRVQKLWKQCSDGHKMFCFSSFNDKDGSELGIYENLLHTASRRGHCAVVKFLVSQIRRGDDCLMGLTTLHRTPLLLACQGGHTACAKLLDADDEYLLNREDLKGQTPFHAACFSGVLELVKLLYNFGAININKSAYLLYGDLNGTYHPVFVTSFVAALLSRSTATVTYLLDLKGIDIFTPAPARGDYIESARPESGPACGLDGKSPVEIAAFLELDGKLLSLIEKRVSERLVPRKRRLTPVKTRAAIAGVQLPPTPEGVRESRLLDSPGSKRSAAQDLQKHQNVCFKKADRAEKKGEVQLNAERLKAQNRQAKGKSRAQPRTEEESDEPSESGDCLGPLFSSSPFGSKIICPYDGLVDPPAGMIYCGHPHPDWCERWRLD